MTEMGPLVITCAVERHGQPWHTESGGWTEADVADLVPALEEIGYTGIRVFDGLADVRERFPIGTRVVATAKYWNSPVGTVTDGSEPTWQCTRDGRQVLVRFDDGSVMTWWARGLEVIGR